MNSTNNPAYESLHETALKAPLSSGVYLWRDPKGTVIYVGKAKNLKNRLSSYFSGEKAIKTRLLISSAASIEYITTANEYEAFLLENNLIKKHSPKYNIQLKDGKSYPALKITSEEFPRVLKVRQAKRDGLLYGPFPDATALDSFLDAIGRIYPLRRCRSFKKRNAPCMYYHIGRCRAPCCGKIDRKTYSEFIEEIKRLLEGKDEPISKLSELMRKAASELNFEKAARIRDGIKALTIMQNQNIVEDFESEDRDYMAHFRDGETVSFTVLKVRSGKLLARDNFRAETLTDDENLMEEFAAGFYTKKEEIPPRIFISGRFSGEFLRRFLNEKFGVETEVISVETEEEEKNTVIEPVEITETAKGKSAFEVSTGSTSDNSILNQDKGALAEFNKSTNAGGFDRLNLRIESKHLATLRMASQNAREDVARRLREKGDFPAMEELKEMLSLGTLPRRIEGFDIAHIGGKFPVASLISFWDGNPDKKSYRYFRLRTTDGIIDDFASMKEATARRYSRLANESAPLPDLILIDGGIGQVNAVDEILNSLGLSIPIAGLAKRDEEIWRPHAKEPVRLPRRSDALRLLQRVRDETHRVATSRNQALRTKENTEAAASAFAALPHVGEKRGGILLKVFGTLEALAAAEESQIAEALHVRGVTASEILLAAKEAWKSRAESIQQKKGQIDAEIEGSVLPADYESVMADAEDFLKVAEGNRS